MRIGQGALQLLERDVGIVVDQFDEKIVVGCQTTKSGVARIIGGCQAQPLTELLRQARRGGRRDHQAPSNFPT